MNMSHRALAIAAACGSLCLASCATVTSTSVASNQPDVATPAVGMIYYLPRQLATVTVTRNSKAVSAAAKAVAEAEVKVAEAKDAITPARQALQNAQAALANGSDNPDGLRILQEAVASARAELTEAQDLLVDRRTNYAARVQDLRDAVKNGDNFKPGAVDTNVAINLLAPSADPAYGFALSPRHSVLRDDEVEITVSRNGLLATADVTATDQTASILVELASIAGARYGTGPELSSQTDECDNHPPSTTRLVDFNNATAIDELNAAMKCQGVRFMLTETGINNGGQISVNQDTAAPNVAHDGLVYRRPLDVNVQIQRCTDINDMCKTGKGWATTQIVVLNLPQAGPIGLIEQEGSLFSSNEYETTFDNGIATEHRSRRTGAALEIARIPMRLVTGFFEAGSRVLQLRTGRAQQELALVNAIAALDNAGITNETQRTNLLLALMNSQANLNNAPITIDTQTSAALLAQQNARAALANGTVNTETQLLAAQLAQLNARSALANGALNLETQLLAAQLAQLNAQDQVAMANIGRGPTILNAELNAYIQTQRALARQMQIENCIRAQVEAGTPEQIDICLPAP